MLEKVGIITFDNKSLDVYYSLDDPIFIAYDVMKMLEYKKLTDVLGLCEPDEVFSGELGGVIDGFSTQVMCLTEHGLYNVLSQSSSMTARKWRKIIHEELIRMRKNKGNDISDQFDDWNHMLDDLYVDDDGVTLMQSVTTPGGDVVQVLYSKVSI